ncbi:hypothetical protein S40288_02413 [Stachybotrys chartarum IBT 40288]|nr:hypothetical protein S40288_02413 [Stachybotrys chartarum IBT 40288]
MPALACSHHQQTRQPHLDSHGDVCACGVTSNTPSPPPTRSKSYMDSLVPPSPEDFERIAQVQKDREELAKRRVKEQKRRSVQEQARLSTGGSQENAAKTIQRTFRGYRTRRELKGYSLDASTRWVTAIREAQFRQSVQPRAKATKDSHHDSSDSATSPGRKAWKKASVVAWRAGLDDLSDSSSASSSGDDALPSIKDRQRGRKETRMMGLEYFLEMVDLKHRHGSNLRKYHRLWANADVNENFFYWLDHGEGKDVEAPDCSREKLDRDRVRYLSAHERLHYLVVVDAEGRLVWAKNNARVDTSDRFRDSLEGIVPVDDPTPAYDPLNQYGHHGSSSSSRSSSSSSSGSSLGSADGADESTNPHKDHTGSRHSLPLAPKLKSRASKSKKKWIFVSDTSFRLYVGIKHAGAFQHSSFVKGSRISAAGLIKIKDGRLRSLKPLSGHYRPPLSNFRAFVHNLDSAGVDLRRVSIKKAYAVVVGLDMYMTTKHKAKAIKEKLLPRRDKNVTPPDTQKQQEKARDRNDGADKEEEEVLDKTNEGH